jgi:hypothetical protein
LVLVGAVALSLQLLSAGCVVEEFETPNTSTRIARHLAAHGEFAIRTGAASPNDSPLAVLRAYQLPGEPLLQAAAFTWLPAPAWRYLHTPIVVVFVLGIAFAGWTTGGERAAIVAGMCAAADPFVFVHGPVWDDAILAAALDWSVVGLVLASARRVAHSGGGSAGWRSAIWILLPALAGAAALTRTASQIFLLLLGLVLVTTRQARVIRPAVVAMLVGCLITMGGWGLRNQAVLGTFLTGSTHDGTTLFESVYRTARPEILRVGVAQYYDSTEAPMLASAVGLGEVAVDRFYRQAAVAYIAAHPLDAGLTALFKLAVSLVGVDFGQPVASARNVGAVGFNVTLLVVAGWGWRQWLRAGGDATRRNVLTRVVFTRAALVLTASTVALLALGPVGLRYRISFAGLLYIGVAMAFMTRPRG